ncbi:hypothetical protein R0G64_32190, partial [Pseudomonas otitidis]|nr:hypothetical protein [Pseudomonas otitidis]
ADVPQGRARAHHADGVVQAFAGHPHQPLGVLADAADGWTVITRDGSLSAQFEHTVLVTETGFRVLTLREE